MRNYHFPLAAAVILLVACGLQAAEKPRPAQGNQAQPKKVWTNDDMDQLRARGLISIVGQEVPSAAAQNVPEAPPENRFPVYESRFDDPQWYADTASDLQAELDQRQADLQQQLDAIALAKDRITQPGLALDRYGAGVTLEAGVANLQDRVGETQAILDELADLARRHNIEPGVLRG
jgi:hypothetical protein